MPQILQTGTTFLNGQTYQASDLNNAVNNATLLTTAISGQPPKSDPADSDQILINDVSGGALKNTTLLNLSQYVSSSLQVYGIESGTSTNAYIVTATQAPLNYVQGLKLIFQTGTGSSGTASGFNTGASTINLNGIGAVAIERNGAALVGGEIAQNSFVQMVYDGTEFQLESVFSRSFSGDSGNGGGIGLVPAPAANDGGYNKVLTASGMWTSPNLSHGQVQLVLTSASQVSLISKNGPGGLIVNGLMLSIATSISAFNISLGTSTLYYAYTSSTAGPSSYALELSTTTHTTGSNGVQVKTGDPTRTYVGMVRTDSSGLFQDSDKQRFVASYFNRQARSLVQPYSGNATISTSYVQCNSGSICEFLIHMEDLVTVSFMGNASNSTLGAATYMNIGIDSGTVAVNNDVGSQASTNNYTVAFNTQYMLSFSEGYHFATALFRVSSNTGTINAANMRVGIR